MLNRLLRFDGEFDERGEIDEEEEDEDDEEDEDEDVDESERAECGEDEDGVDELADEALIGLAIVPRRAELRFCRLWLFNVDNNDRVADCCGCIDAAANEAFKLAALIALDAAAAAAAADCDDGNENDDDKK